MKCRILFVLCLCTLGVLVSFGCMSPLPSKSNTDLHNQPQGNNCSSNGQCLEGLFCVDGVCCNSACTNNCEACTAAQKGYGANGVCEPIADNYDPDSECIGTDTVCGGSCNGVGACKYPDTGLACTQITGDPGICNGAGICGSTNQLPKGQPCVEDNQCLSGFCVDNVCCNSVCDGECQTCNLPSGVAGECRFINDGDDPSDKCNGTGVCGGTCNGSGACKYPASGLTCSITDGADQIPGVCDGIGDCVLPTRKPDGVACIKPTECQSGWCVDGVCCNSECKGTCLYCALPNHLGQCSFIPPNMDPDDECIGAESCNGNGACTLNPPKLPLGGTCTLNDQCTSGYCTDGVCCNDACAGTCSKCNLAGYAGQCLWVPDDADPDNECAGDDPVCGGLCDGFGACKFAPLDTTCSLPTGLPAICNSAGECISGQKVDGQPCTQNNQCISGFCVDNVCCDDICNGACVACSAAKKGSGADGECGMIVNGQDPDNECDGNDPTCGGTCNGSGVCQIPAAGILCGAPGQQCDGTGACVTPPLLGNGRTCTQGSECSSDNCVDNVCCDGVCSGTCEACDLLGSKGTCTPVPAGQSDLTCLPPQVCNGTRGCVTLPAPKDNGVACSQDSECQSLHCKDGVCCNSACDGTCEACNLTGVEGICSPIPAPQDPENECVGNDPTCGGVCSGNRSCQFALVDTICGTGFICDGAGACVPAPLNNNGQLCSLPGDCQSGHCVDGVCCDSDCTETCKACNVPGEVGTCSNVPAAVSDSPTCANPAVCNGLGECVGVSSTLPNGSACSLGSQCTSTFCADGVCCDTVCSGFCEACSTAKKGSGANGVCGPIDNGLDPDNECTGTDPTCGGVCNGAGVCRFGAVDIPCTGGVCDGTGLCVSKANGVTCGSGAECTSGFCVDGYCCNSSCTGTCLACNVAGNLGSCVDVPLGQTDLGTCAAPNACDGAGHCSGLVSCTADTQCDDSNPATVDMCNCPGPRSGGDCTAAGACVYTTNGCWPFWVELPANTEVTMVKFWGKTGPPWISRDVPITPSAVVQEIPSAAGECSHTEIYPTLLATCEADTFPVGAPTGTTRISYFGDNREVDFCTQNLATCAWGGAHDGACH